MAQHRTFLRSRRIVGILSLLGVVGATYWLLNSGDRSFVDVTKSQNLQSLTTRAGKYENVVWLTDNRFAFLYAPIPHTSAGDEQKQLHPSDYQAVVYTSSTQEWHVLPVPESTMCVSAWIVLLERLPNGQLGFVYQCSTYDEHVTGWKDTLYTWDRQLTTIELVQHFPEQFGAGFSAFAPDMSVFIQEQQTGGIRDELYRVDQDGHMERLLAGYERLRSPSWSPDGHTIAFAGTETVPEPGFNPFTSLSGLSNLVLYPWDLYLMDPDGKNVRIALSEVKQLSIIKWSPNGDRLAFRGEYKRRQGIWVFNPSTSQLIRVWADLSDYDWSPDGQQMVVLQQTEENGIARSHPVIIDVADTK